MKALSVVRPHGGRIASGQKTLEIRRWDPELAPCEDLLIVENGRLLHTEGDRDSDGIAVAIVKVKAVRPFTRADMNAACVDHYADGWLAWELRDIRPLVSASPVFAARGIYEVDVRLLEPGQ